MQPAHRAEAEQQAECAAAHREQDVLGQEQANQRPPAGANRRANGDLTLARDAARQREVRQVGASDQQHQACGGHQHEQGCPHVRPDERIGVAFDDDAPSFVRIWKLPFDAGPNRGHVGLGLLQGNARFQSRKRHQPVKISRHVRGLEREWPPELVERAVEGASRRQHADHRVGLVVEKNRAIDDRGICSELVDPEHMAQNHHVILPPLVFVGQERAASLRPDAEDVEIVRRDSRPTKLDGFPAAREGRGAAGLSGHEFEDGVVLLPVEEVQCGDAVAVAAGRLLENTHNPIGLRVRQRSEQDAIDEAEDRGVGADAECQREDRD